MKYFLLFLILICSNATAALNDVDKAFLVNKNILTNPGFENGKASWSASAGVFSLVTSGSNLLTGKSSITWDATAAGNTLSHASLVIPNGLKGKSGAAFCSILTPSGTSTHSLQITDGTSVLASQAVTSSSGPATTSVTFVFPNSGSIVLRVYANADEPLVAIDDCFIGEAKGTYLSDISQPTLVGVLSYVASANCLWSRTSTVLGEFTADPDAAAPTIITNPGNGTISTADNKLPQMTVTNLPPGIYTVKVTTTAAQSISAYGVLQISDGTTFGSRMGFNAANTTNESSTVTATFTYTTAQSSRTYKLNGLTSGGSLSIDCTNFDTVFEIYRYPTAPELTYTPDKTAMSWSGYHDNTCSWGRTNAAYGDPTADATCALVERTNQNFGAVTTYTVTNAMPGIVFTPKRNGRYFVCAKALVGWSAINTAYSFRLWDGINVLAEGEVFGSAGLLDDHTMCGILDVSSLSSKTVSIQTKGNSGTITIASQPGGSSSVVEWSIFSIDQQFPMPAIVNSIVTPDPGVTKHSFCRVIGSTGTKDPSGGCDNWVTSISHPAAGHWTLNVTGYNTKPSCQVTLSTNTATNPQYWPSYSFSTSTNTVLDIYSFGTTGGLADRDFTISCDGG